MTSVLVVGSGAGGATVARELAGSHDVTVLEAGGPFSRFGWNLDVLARARATGLFLDARMIRILFPAMHVRRLRGSDRLIHVNGTALGGTTTMSAGNALRCDEDLKASGIDLDAEFAELAREVPISRDHRSRWTPTTLKLESACRAIGLDPTADSEARGLFAVRSLRPVRARLPERRQVGRAPISPRRRVPRGCDRNRGDGRLAGAARRAGGGRPRSQGIPARHPGRRRRRPCGGWPRDAGRARAVWHRVRAAPLRGSRCSAWRRRSPAPGPTRRCRCRSSSNGIATSSRPTWTG